MVIDISVVVAILAEVSVDPPLVSFRWASMFAGVCYLTAAAIIAVTFPSGSSADRARTSWV